MTLSQLSLALGVAMIVSHGIALAQPDRIGAWLRQFPRNVPIGVVLMLGGNIPGVTRVVSTQIYGHVEATEYAQAHALSALMVGFSFAVLLALALMRRRGSRVMP